MYYAFTIFNNGKISSVGALLDQKKMPKELYDWLVSEVMEYHEGNEDAMKKVKSTKSRVTPHKPAVILVAGHLTSKDIICSSV